MLFGILLGMLNRLHTRAFMGVCVSSALDGSLGFDHIERCRLAHNAMAAFEYLCQRSAMKEKGI
jgi:hypothetical protein